MKNHLFLILISLAISSRIIGQSASENSINTMFQSIYDCTAFGADALNFGPNIGIGNTAVGRQSLSNNINGEYNTSVGNDALSFNSFGNHNCALGADALWYNGWFGSYGHRNTGLGSSALKKKCWRRQYINRCV